MLTASRDEEISHSVSPKGLKPSCFIQQIDEKDVRGINPGTLLIVEILFPSGHKETFTGYFKILWFLTALNVHCCLTP